MFARWARIIAVGAAVLLGATNAGAAAKVARTKVVYQEDRGVVAPNMTDGFNESCPTSAPHAINGYFGSTSATASGKLTLAFSYPYGKGDRHWTVDVKNLSDLPETYFVGVVCVSAAHSFVRREETGSIDVGGNDGGAVACPKTAPHAVGGYFGPQSLADEGEFLLAQSVPQAGGWATQLSNYSMRPQAYFVGVVCAPRTAKVAYLGTKQRALAAAETQGAVGRCSGRTPHAVDGIYAIPQSASFGPVTLVGSSKSGSLGRDWIVAVTNLSQQPQAYFGGTVCIS